MNRIVETGMKIDLHIHSIVSSNKDKKKVINNTIENIPILIDKLNENGVNICAITDHDAFSFEMYTTLKSAENQLNSIKKVLPGVEFTVKFEHEEMSKVINKSIHIVAIFCDNNQDKIKKIESILNKNRPELDGAYLEENFLKLLREIDLDTILIAHQKNTLTSKKARDNDANVLGKNKFLEFVYTDYFEAFEFKNKRNEVLNKTFLIQEGLDELRFVTGTDCHDWNVYPAEDPADNLDEFPYTYAKCLPTFKGLVMAMTDNTRLKTVNSFFNNADKNSIESIEMESHKRNITIPLSKGVNVIIGDNSVGKSMLLHALTGFNKNGNRLPTKVQTGYKEYLKKNGLKIKTVIPTNQIFCFDMQGEVRRKFEENTLNATAFLGEHFPSAIDSQPYKNIVNNEINKMINYLDKKFQLDTLIEKLNTFPIVFSEKAESMTFLKNLRSSKPRNTKMLNINSVIDEILIDLKKLLNLEIDTEDKDFINLTHKNFIKMKQKYGNKIKLINNECEQIENIAKIIDKIAEKHIKNISDNQKRDSLFATNTSSIKTQLIDIIKLKQELPVYQPLIEDTKIIPSCNKIFAYEFISRLNIDMIGTKYFNSLIGRVLKANKVINWNTITENELQEILLRYDPNIPVLQFLRKSLENILNEDLSQKSTIICEGSDKYEEMSSGLDAKIYFDILSYETNKDGIYIIDQPEDNISQSAIKTYLLDRFKTMGENRQIIMVTHNPQFIVNLDVDNLIFMTQKDGEIQVESGALEYVCNDYNVLDIVAKNIDGGLDTIQKRWKRYEKVTNV